MTTFKIFESDNILYKMNEQNELFLIYIISNGMWKATCESVEP
jgi:hypothetical protein